MKNKINILALILSIGLVGCNSKEKKKDIQPHDKEVKELIEALQSKIDSPEQFSEIWKNFPIKQAPVVDSTNFANINEISDFYEKDIEVLQLHKIYPNLEKEGHNYRFLPSYRLELSDDFYSLVLNVFKGDHELESILINYNLGEKLIAHKIIAYDEIAEGWSRKHAKVEQQFITVIDEFYDDTTQIDTTKFHINRDGYINEIKTEFASNIRPDEVITLNKTYADTITFSSYSDGGDYNLLFGNKKGIDHSLIYKWDWELNQNKYNFKSGDMLAIKWKMDSIWLAGDGETLDFKETIIDAERIQSGNKAVTFLWREGQYDEESQQSINSIFINEPFVNSITNQEKAALGFVASFIGNECSWDGDVNEERSNLKCKILTALDLGYQCSDTHYGFLKQWFSEDGIALKELEVCHKILETATVQSTFDEILIATDKDKKTIEVSYKAHSINHRESKEWSWTETDFFEYTSENVTWVDVIKSKLVEKTLNNNPDN
ncbi:hypothetical protein [Maribacter sp.]|uniref:hypothetical protein n=1 Tax=Maribacter sp. TaxID=1897614 RepID=UPI0025C2C012|nr:hypothetical protein [Maribacter sp.]